MCQELKKEMYEMEEVEEKVNENSKRRNKIRIQNKKKWNNSKVKDDGVQQFL